MCEKPGMREEGGDEGGEEPGKVEMRMLEVWTIA
jgi:hypothetical protein